MIFNQRSIPPGAHALLSPSNGAWVNYDEDKLDRVFHSVMTAKRGTELHELAHRAIKLGVKLPDNGQTLSMYVNDAIGFRMRSEQLLYYSENCFGTADCIVFNETQHMLRIHDLKNGVLEASMRQLEIYAALFCLEYRKKPTEIGIELRIYQNDDVRAQEPESGTIFYIMEQIRFLDQRLKYLAREVAS